LENKVASYVFNPYLYILKSNQMKETLARIVFGPRATGKKLPTPTLRTTPITNRPDENQWAIEFKVGSRYGHRGSFYQTR
jgi:hypothetical protein